MQRRHFIHSLIWLTGGIVTSCNKKLALGGSDGNQTIKGTVTSDGKGIAGVVVSDGYNVALTDDQGIYQLPAHPQARHIFISTPSGHVFSNKEGNATFYKRLDAGDNFDFALQHLAVNDNEHQFLIWADPQVKSASDIQKMMTQSVPDVQRLVGTIGTKTPIHGITVGDIAWDELKVFADYKMAVKQMNIPFFQCLGNHDMDYNQGGDETSDKTFQQFFGPTYYSFNRGQVHYVVMDDVRYLGSDRDYDGYITSQQLEWLKKDLSFVSSDKLIILCVHIPVHSSVKNKADLYSVLSGRNVHIMSGHTHYHNNVIQGNIYEHNHGTVCGAWWTGPICEDGTPCGYGVYKVKGTELSWHYQSTGQAADHQFRIFIQDFNATQKQVKVNIWNYDPAWKTEYRVDGVTQGPLEQFEGFDPAAYAALLGPNLPDPRGFAEPRMTNHLFRAFIPNTAQEITIAATDRFGKTYTITQKV